MHQTHTYVYHTAGQDATEAFFAVHRSEVLEKPQYAKLRIGTLASKSRTEDTTKSDRLSTVPYGEPTWLSPGFKSPYYKEVLLHSQDMF
jgi:hypothetical protein